jgi:hypothetical protein
MHARFMFALAALVSIRVLCSYAAVPAEAGKPAPDFSLKDAKGQTYTLSDLKGKYVVLEWVNFGCPFVRKHYNSGNMPSLQKTYTAKNVVWLSVCSSAPGKQGYFETQELTEAISTMKASPSAYLLDPDGTVGRLYDAKATPTMFVIDPHGTVIYGGAIDNIPSTNVDDVAKARNYVKEALDLALAGKHIEVTGTRAYGCSVKYKD